MPIKAAIAAHDILSADHRRRALDDLVHGELQDFISKLNYDGRFGAFNVAVLRVGWGATAYSLVGLRTASAINTELSALGQTQSQLLTSSAYPTAFLVLYDDQVPF